MIIVRISDLGIQSIEIESDGGCGFGCWLNAITHAACSRTEAAGVILTTGNDNCQDFRGRPGLPVDPNSLQTLSIVFSLPGILMALISRLKSRGVDIGLLKAFAASTCAPM